MAAGGKEWDRKLQKLASCRELIQHNDNTISSRWLTGGDNDFGRLFYGFNLNQVEGPNVLEWILRSTSPSNKTVTYPRYTASVQPEKDEKYRVRIIAGGDRIEYDGDITIHTASMETIKTHWKLVIFTPNAKYCTGNISNMYLMSDLVNSEYVKFKYELVSPRAIEYNQLYKFVNNGYIYIHKINKAWYGLKSQEKISHNNLVQHLAQ